MIDLLSNLNYSLIHVHVPCTCKSSRWYFPLKADFGREIHAVSSSSKPLAGFTARDGIQECREACGGHGFLAGKMLLLPYTYLPGLIDLVVERE